MEQLPVNNNYCSANKENNNNNKTNEIPKIEMINQSIVRLNANYGGEIIDNEDLLIELSYQFVIQDTPLSLSYLLSLSNVRYLYCITLNPLRYL